MQNNHLLALDILNQSDHLVYSLDLEQKFSFVNRTMLKLSGFQKEDQLVAKQYSDMRCEGNLLAKEFLEQDKKTIRLKNKTEWLGIVGYADADIKTMLGTKEPLIDGDGEIKGTFSHFMDVTTNPLINLAPLLKLQKMYTCSDQNQITVEIVDKQSSFGLTKREHEVMFYLLSGLTAKQVASKLFISSRTVEHHIDSVKNKHDCAYKSQLIEKLLCSGLLSTVPKSVITRVF